MDKLNQAKIFFNTFYKCIKNIKMYGNVKSNFEKFLDETYEHLQGYLNSFGPLVLNIEESKIMFENNTIYEDKNKITSLPLYFYRNGIRSITFLDAIEKREIEKFITIISQHDFSIHMNLIEDLWVENFSNILFYFVEEAPKDYSWMIEKDVPTDKFDFTLEKTESSFLNFKKIEGKEEPSIITETLENERTESVLKTVLNIYLLETDEEKRKEILTFIKDFIKTAINEGNIIELISVVDFSKEAQIPLKNFEDLIYSESALELYFNYLQDKDKREKIAEIMINGGGKILPSIKEFLKSVDSPELFKFFKNVVIEICKKDKDALSFLLPVPKSFVPYLLEIISIVKEPSYSDFIIPFFKMEEFKNTAIKIFLEVAHREKWFKFLNEDDDIRISILRNIKSIENENEFKIIREKIVDNKFWSLHPEERENLLRIFSSWRKEDVLPVFEMMLRKFSLKKEIISTKISIIRILSRMGKDGISILKKFKKSFILRNAIKEVLKNYGKN
uniref:HEAT repeat domain-containing protein n=1 Tax=candidate division WOR-3 bacterium TaxID=2052148 RepID=A0A7C4UBJ6_UNCW3